MSDGTLALCKSRRTRPGLVSLGDFMRNYAMLRNWTVEKAEEISVSYFIRVVAL